ncbi:MAG: protein-export chaperone SecB [Gammaproteobacteria bacterium]
MAEEKQSASQDENKPALRPEKIYLKDVSFETPNSPTIFTLEWQPQLNFDIGQKVAKVSDEGLYEVVLVLTATTTVNDKTAYLAEVQQAGIFTIQNTDQAQLDRLLAVVCPRMLYPYACAALSDLVSRGGFPQLLLAPLNFDALYQQRLDEAQQKAAMQASESS